MECGWGVGRCRGIRIGNGEHGLVVESVDRSDWEEWICREVSLGGECAAITG